MKPAIVKLLAGRDLSSEFYLVRNMSAAEAWALLVLTAAIVAFVAIIVIGRVKSVRVVWREERTYLLPVITLLAFFTVFFSLWDSSNVEFWVLQSVCVWLVLDRIIGRMTPRVSRIARIALPVALFAINFFGDIVHLRSAENDYY